jgi:hypothetical protein
MIGLIRAKVENKEVPVWTNVAVLDKWWQGKVRSANLNISEGKVTVYGTPSQFDYCIMQNYIYTCIL